MNSLNVYIPRDRQYALATGAELPELCRGCVLFADISGFTPLTAALAEQFGPQRGAEELSRYLNRVFDDLIVQVERFGGSIIGFAGDAMTCWFDETLPPRAESENDAPLAGSSARAVGCAVAMQELMARIGTIATSSASQITLAIKIAVTHGTCRRFLVGSPQHQLVEVLAGALLDRMAAAEQRAQPGEILVGAEVALQLEATLRVDTWRVDRSGQRLAVVAGLKSPVPPMPWPTLPPLSDELARPWLLSPIYARLQRGEGEFVAELRSVVALFVKFEGIDYDAEPDASQRLDRFVRWVQEQLAFFEGFLLQLTVGDKGSFFYASFGAPLVHEDDPARAIATALTLQAVPPELAYIKNVRIGISQGQMRVGAYGGSQRRTYGVLGSEANVAARLMAMASPGQTLVTPRVSRAARERFHFDNLGAKPIKGLAEPLQLFGVRGKSHSSNSLSLKGRAPTPIVGRATELLTLSEEIATLREARGTRGLVIEADAGFGKSRLVLEIESHAREMGIEVFTGAAMAVESRTSHFAWRQLFQQLFQFDRPSDELDGVGRRFWRQQVQQLVADALPELEQFTPLLNTVLSLDIPENSFTEQLSGQVRADNTHELLVRLLQHFARKAPLLLIFEDAHWLDSASWRLLGRVQSEVQPLLLVLATRPLDEAARPEYFNLVHSLDTRHLRLGPFSTPEVEALVAQRLGVATLPAPLLDLIVEKAEGHPFFSEEIAYTLRDQGLITVADGMCAFDAARLRSLEFPDTIQGVIAGRIDRLAASTQLTLKVASVIGRSFLYRALHAIHPVEYDRLYLEEYLDTLDRLEITKLEQDEPEQIYRFKHVLIQDVAYNMLLFTQRGQLHRLVAEWYERIYSADLSPHYPLLAYHWGEAAEAQREQPELVTKAITYCELAGEQALNNYANQEAVRFLTQALALDAQRRGAEVEQSLGSHLSAVVRSAQARRATWERQLGEAYEKLGRLAECRSHYERALALLGYPMPADRQELVGRLLWQIGRIARRQLGLLTPPLADRPMMLEAAKIFMALTPLYYVHNETHNILYAHLHTQFLASPSGASPVLAEIYATLAVAMGMIPLHSAARGYVERAETTARSLGRMSTQALVNHRVSIYLSSSGDTERARLLLNEGMELSAQLGDWTRWRECAYGMRRVLGYQGKLQQAVEVAERLYKSAVRSGHRQHQSWGYAQRALSKASLGAWDEALLLAEQALEIVVSAKLQDTTPMVSAYAAQIRSYLAKGDFDAAIATADTAEQIIPRSTRTHPLYLDVFAAVAEVRLRQLGANSADQKAQAALQQICQLLKRFARQHKVVEPVYWHYWGRFQWLLGKQSEGQRALRRGLALATALELPVEAANIHVALAHTLASDDPEREQQLLAAQAICARLALSPKVVALEADSAHYGENPRGEGVSNGASSRKISGL